jgi:hypothetical protein
MPPPTERAKPPAPEPASTSAAVDQEDIQRVLGRYRSAFNDLDPAAAQTVWPSVNTRALEKAFDSLAEQGIEFNDCRITVTGVRAIAACAGSTRYVTKVGNRQPRTEPRRWTFNLRKADRQWLIDAVEAR